MSKLREHPKALNTTFIWKHLKGTQLTVGSNGNKFKDIWTIRSQVPTFVMLEYGKGSETRWISA